MSSPDEQSSYMEPLSPIGRTQLGLAASFVTPSPKKMEGKADRAVDDKPYINERKRLTFSKIITLVYTIRPIVQTI